MVLGQTAAPFDGKHKAGTPVVEYIYLLSFVVLKSSVLMAIVVGARWKKIKDTLACSVPDDGPGLSRRWWFRCPSMSNGMLYIINYWRSFGQLNGWMNCCFVNKSRCTYLLNSGINAAQILHHDVNSSNAIWYSCILFLSLSPPADQNKSVLETAMLS